MTTTTKERPVIFSSEMVRAILDGRKTRRRCYVRKGEDRDSPIHIARRLANGLDVAEPGACWEWKRTRNNHGYGTLKIHGRTAFAHRIAFELASARPIPAGLHVLHRCDNPSCINPEHLFLGTRSDNMRDCFSKGRSSVRPQSLPGERNPQSRLTLNDVDEIRRLAYCGVTQQAIADQFGVSQSQVSNIVRRRQWR